jgi:hypothetical protein
MISGYGIFRTMRSARAISLIIVSAIFHTGCVNNGLTPTLIPTEPAPTHTPTSTFAIPTIPPTETLTPSPVPTATPDPQAGLGRVILADDFSENLGWELFDDQLGAASIRQGKMILTISEPRGLRYAIAPVVGLSDLYVEVEVRPELCQADDEFGLLFRINAQFEYYRFAINCSGQTRLSRILVNGSRALSPLTLNSAVIPGPMANNHLAIRADGDQFQIWINGIEALTVRDVSIQSGSIGLFVRSGRGDLATISFDNLLIRETLQQPPPTPTGDGS